MITSFTTRVKLMPAQINITLTAQEKKQLEKNVRSKTTPVRLVERSRIILLAAKNVPNYKIAEELEIDVNKVGRWRCATSTDCCVSNTCACCTEDEGRPLGAALQEEASNHLKLRR